MPYVIHIRLKRNGFWYEYSTDYPTSQAAKKAATAMCRNLDIRIVAESALKRPRRLFEDIENLSSLEIRGSQLATKRQPWFKTRK